MCRAVLSGSWHRAGHGISYQANGRMAPNLKSPLYTMTFSYACLHTDDTVGSSAWLGWAVSMCCDGSAVLL